MTGKEIAKLIEDKYSEIDTIMTPEFFTANKEIARIESEIEALREQCPHEYSEGICIYCNKEENA